MADFTLDDIRAAAAKKYKGLTISLGDGHEVELQNLLRIPKERRKVVTDLQDRDGEDIDGVIDGVREAIVALSDSTDNGRALVEMIGGDDALLLHIFKEWQGRSQAGEAEPSES